MDHQETEAYFEELYHLSYRDVSAYVIARVRDPDRAKDILQNSYLSFWRQLQKGRVIGKEACVPYLKTIARHEAGRQFLSDKKQRASCEPLDDWENELVAPDDPEKDMIDADTLHRLYQAIRHKDSLTYKIFLLVYEVGLTLSEAATELNLPLHTVRNRLYRTLSELKRAFPEL